MKRILGNGRGLLEIESIGSTQTELAERVRRGDVTVTAILALEQTAGRGRFGRKWYSPKFSCLALSFALYDYANWQKPELLGMAVGIAAAKVLGCQLAWPNDLMYKQKKLGGVISEIIRDPNGKLVPVIGVGANLTVWNFPKEIQGFASSLMLEGLEVPNGKWDEAPRAITRRLFEEIEALPEPYTFSEIESLWNELDCTRGKKYKLPDGRIAEAEKITEQGYLVANTGGEIVVVPSAIAWFGEEETQV